MLIKKGIIPYFGIILCCYSYSEVYAGTAVVNNTGQQSTATLTLPLSATITQDTIIRNTIDVRPISSLYEFLTWNKNTEKFEDHHLLIRVLKDTATNLRFEIVNDQYTCSYHYTDWHWTNTLPVDIAVANRGYNYSYSIKSPQGTESGSLNNLGVNDLSRLWSDTIDGSNKKFIDITLKIQFPNVINDGVMRNRGGLCRGSVTMLISDRL